MKKFKFILPLAAFLIFTACNKEDSMRKDAKEFAALTCESMKLMGKALEGDASAQAKMEELSDKMENKSDELDRKYPSDEEKQKLGQMIMEEAGECE